MVKKALSIISIIIMLIALVSILGCSLTSNTTNPSAPASIKTIREAKIGSEWAMKQLEITEGIEVSILLKIADGDKVDGYFYVEKGNGVGFRITGNSLIYESADQDTKNPSVVTSDRFSFVASQEQGIAYTLTLSNTADSINEKSNTTIFLEIIYPASGSIFIPIETD